MTNLRLVSQTIRGGRLRSFAFARLERLISMMTNLRLVSQNIRGGQLRSFAFARLERFLKISHLHYNLTNLTIEELISSPKASSLEVVASDISVVIKQLLELTFETLQSLNLGGAINKVISSFVSAASSALLGLLCYQLGTIFGGKV
ncbi:hypothetical protein TEA_030096 [Camellia sinensis var. sinensis]|uniref:Uncharacterized protein n=1 Tax=Camellia sinensis var. sinensis TaxID=542762 RepID=A0A4S4DRT5_CAMSN|nr:hypothetical protein TEA_030096 [Camellia sinensis var. sinensis]